MRAEKKTTIDKKLLQELVPLNALSPERFQKVSEKIIIEEVLAGHYLFRKGDKDNQSIYLLSGKINLIDGFRKVTSEIEAGTDMSRYAISNQQPRPLSARAVKKSIIARIDSGLLDVFLTWDQSSSPEVVEIEADDNQDWMTRILQTEAFIKIPPAMIQSLLMKMQSCPVKAGDVVIRQGEPGDFFYTIHVGRCLVSRKDSPEAEGQVLAELGDGDSFGEDALVSDVQRNATITMLTDGVLMRLAKEDFLELLKSQLVKHVDIEQATAMVDEGAVWVDVRTVDEYGHGTFEDSVNMPLANLRKELAELVFNTKYIICCDTGRRSESAGFLLSHRGFDVYVLEGGIPSSSLEPADVGERGSSSADAGQSVTGSSGATDESLAAASAAHARVLETVREENEKLHAKIKEYQSAGSGSDEQIEQLRSELDESVGKLNDLHTQTQEDAEQLEHLRGELGESGEKLDTLYAQMKCDADAMQQLQEQYTALQEQHATVVSADRKKLEQLGGKLTEVESQAESARERYRVLEQGDQSVQATLQQEMQQLQDALNTANERVLALESKVVSTDEAGTALLNEAEGHLQEQQQLVTQLREELTEAGKQMAVYQEEAGTAAAEREASGEVLQNEVGSLRQELEAVTGQLGEASGQAAALQEKNSGLSRQLASLQSAAEAGSTELESEVAAAKAQQQELEQQVETLQASLDAQQQEVSTVSEEKQEAADALQSLQQENSGLKKQLEDLQSAAEAGSTELEGEVAAAKLQQQELEQQVETLQTSLDAQQQELSTVSEEKQEAADVLQSLQQENEKLQAELRETARLLDKQVEAASDQLSARQGTEEVIEKQRVEWDSERTALQQAVADGQQNIEVLQTELDQLREVSEQHQSGQEKQQQEQDTRAKEQLEQLQQSLDESNEERSRLEGELESLAEQATAMGEDAATALQQLQEQLETEQTRAAGLEQTTGDKDVTVRDLQEEILQSAAAKSALEQELEALRQQQDGMQEQLQKQAGLTKELEQEHDESIQKAHEDLTRKNENEKELQGQINRLRKKLEQSTADLQRTRDGSQTDVDNIREELHAERQARSDERAQMAARQRELKEQLASIATVHEANVSNHTGAIEQARDAGREEQQERLRSLVEAQSQSEEQLLALQEELQKAHNEIGDLTRQEKDRRQVDMAMMEELNQQTLSTVTQLESQLKQLTLDRDASLEEQQALREKMNTLRGEVEVARGLMNVDKQGQVEDPEKLRHDLDESKRNMSIALRLRAEAEAARDQLITERDELREKLGQEAPAGTPIRVPSLDAGKAGSGHPGPRQATAGKAAAAIRANPVNRERGNNKPSPTAAFGRRWLGAAIGLGVAGAVAVAAWLLVDSGNIFSGETDAQAVAAVDVHADVAATPAPAALPDSRPVEVNEPRSEQQAPVAAPAEPVAAKPVVTKPVVAVPVVKELVVKEPVVKEPVIAEPPVVEAPADTVAEEIFAPPRPAPVLAVRTFQDSLKDGSSGPMMVELPATEFMMGSAGNSLNFDESPRHRVNLNGFSIGKHEVTFADFDRFSRATGRRMPYDESWGRDNRPVIHVSWKDAQAYTKWLSEQTGNTYRLPTEAEWEYAARAGSNALLWWDPDADFKPANCYDCGSEWDGERTAPAGSFKGNNFSLYDMAGNVQEWTADCYHIGYNGAPEDGSAWLTPHCSQRVVRGGGYTSPLDSLRNAKRGQYDQDARLDNLGFRVVRVN